MPRPIVTQISDSPLTARGTHALPGLESSALSASRSPASNIALARLKRAEERGARSSRSVAPFAIPDASYVEDNSVTAQTEAAVQSAIYFEIAFYEKSAIHVLHQ